MCGAYAERVAAYEDTISALGAQHQSAAERADDLDVGRGGGLFAGSQARSRAHGVGGVCARTGACMPCAIFFFPSHLQ
jgi:hypothetical protein